ncbi:hypothetical protein J6590_052160 [Homalodisca vitripennis]|nr:hypothetical protein J6590_052160 [Homalodisca vitripennis]
MTQNALLPVIVSDLEVIHHCTDSVGVNALLLVIVSDLEVIHHCTDSVGVVSLHLFHHILIRITVGYIVTNPVPQECGRTLTAVVVLLFKCG